MTETLSEQICNECGVKPLFLCKIHSEQKCETVYPDFENNSNNFVKLFEIKVTDNVTIAQLFFTWNIANYSRELFLKNLIYILKEDSNMDKTVIEFIKQAIRNEQWEI